jgi:hypothetical protein
MSSKAKIKIGSKEYEVQVLNGEPYINGMTVDEFTKTLDPLT